jgi:SAM-dependent methyltransferase
MSDPTKLFTDRAHLTTKSYATGANLAARQSIYQYQRPRADFVGWALDQATWRGGERVLDAGCGNGAYLLRLRGRGVGRLTGLDLSRGMLRENAGLGVGLANGDVQALPFESGSFDVVLAMHMLYHVPDIQLAAAELRRVLRPDGVLLAAANATDHLAEITEAIGAAHRLLGVSAEQSGAETRRFLRGMRFGRDNGAELLGGAFSRIEWRDSAGDLHIPEAGPLVAYLNSTRTVYEPSLPPGVRWDELAAAFERHVGERIARDGVFHVRAHAGLFVCS